VSKCKTCESLKFIKSITKKDIDIEYKYYAKICEFSFKKGVRKIPQNNIGSTLFRAVNLNYCPTCGEKIRK